MTEIKEIRMTTVNEFTSDNQLWKKLLIKMIVSRRCDGDEWIGN